MTEVLLLASTGFFRKSEVACLHGGTQSPSPLTCRLPQAALHIPRPCPASETLVFGTPAETNKNPLF